MSFRIWQSTLTAKDLASGNIGERDALKYMLLGAVLYTQAVYSALWFGTYRDWTFFLELAVMLAISLVGIHECYKANGGNEGIDFIKRFAVLSVPVGVNVAVAGLIVSQGVYWGAPHVLGGGAFQNPERVYRHITLLMPLVFAFIYYWRIAHHIGTVRTMGQQSAGAA